MEQTVISIAIVAFTIGYTIFKIIKSLQKKRQSVCDDGGCSGCEIKNKLKNLPVVKEHIATQNNVSST